ncbi:MAG: CPXCG motif-containing cysteine-rich protein [Woeseiaceae bacterium]
MDRWLTERKIECPFCAESITILLDASGGSQEYVEDCQVCCRPIRIRLHTDASAVTGVDVDCAS